MKRILFPLLVVPLLCVAAGCLQSSTSGNETVITPDSVETPLPEQPRKASIVFAGDAMQHKGQLNCARQKDGTYSFDGYYTAVEPYINSADYAVVNLETTLGASNFSGYPMFCAPDAFARELKSAGFDMMLTANNHTLDRRDAGLRRTLDVLDAMGVDHIGTYRDAAERAKALPKIIDINGFKVGMLNYTYATNGIPVQGKVVVDYIDRSKIKKDIAAARSAGAELICVSIHWGEEYRLLPVASEKQLAKFLVDEGVDIINGGHPHVIQPMEMRKGPGGKDVVVIYSLGNFVSDMRKTDTQGGCMAKVFLTRDDDGTARVEGAEYLPTFVIRGVAGKSNHQVMIADSVTTGPSAPLARAFLKSAYGIFNKHNINVPRSRDF